jgi:DNA adenine methylase
MAKNKLIAPFVKWVGGKRQLMPEIIKLVPKKISIYYEPFVGGGAVLFALQQKKALINDANSELINVYNMIKYNLEELIIDLKTHKNDPDYFYKLRSLDREVGFESISNVKKASRIIYLNKTCYNGLYRVNSSGEFNSPFGKYKNPNIVNDATLKAVSEYLNNNDIQIINGDYSKILTDFKKDSFVYFDPPYHPVSQSSNFTGYTQGGFNLDDQIKLRDKCNELNSKGIKFLLSNSATPIIEELYSNYRIHYVKANRAVNSIAERRGEIDEVLIRNYE